MLAVYALALGAALVLTGPVSEREGVQALASRATAAFAAGDFRAARGALLEALAIEPDNMSLVYGLAQAERFLENCPRAVELFDRFLVSDPPQVQAKEARARRAECTDDPPPEPPADDPPTPPPPIVKDPTPEPNTPPDRPHRAGPVLVGVGSGVALMGVALVAAAFGTAANAPSASTEEEYRSRSRRVVPLAAAGWTTLGVGVTLAIAGGITWGVARSKRGKAVAAVGRWTR